MARVPPHNIEAEMSVLGSMLLGDGGAVEKAAEVVKAVDFYRPTHGEIFTAMLLLRDSDQPIDPVTLKEALTKRGTLDQVGGVGYLLQLGDVEFTTANVEHYAKIVKEKSRLRTILEHCSLTAGAVYAGDIESDELLRGLEQNLLSEDLVGSQEGGFVGGVEQDKKFAVAFAERREKGDGMSGLPTRFKQIDRMTKGFPPGALIIIAARPAVGKSALASQLADNVAWGLGDGDYVAVLSAEMDSLAWQNRRVSQWSRVPNRVIQDTHYSAQDGEKMDEARRILRKLPVLIDDTPAISITQIESKVRRLKAERRRRPSMIVVDYLQYVMPAEDKRFGNREQEVTDIARRLKRLARVYRCPVVALAQLNREVERREDKRPMLSDLRESGGIEAEADMVAFLYRPALYDGKQDPASPEDNAEFIVAKQRNGPTGIVKMVYNPGILRWDCLDKKGDNLFDE